MSGGDTRNKRVDEAAQWLRDRERAMEDVLAELVELNSFTENVEGGKLVGDRLVALFAIPGFETERVHSARFADHLIIRSSGPSVGAPVALVGHLDTVFPPGIFEGYRRDGDLSRGPGVLDMKSGLVTVAYALKALAETGGLADLPPLRVVIVADEEVGSPEGRGVIERVINDASACLVFESGRANDAIVTRRKGTGGVIARAYGRAAHAGLAHKDGANAIRAIARFIEGVEQLTDYARGITVNVGRVSGGVGKNTVPELAEALVDFRFETRADADALVAKMGELASTVCLENTRIELEGGVLRMPLERSDASGRLLDEYGTAAKRFGLGASEAPLSAGGSDANTAGAMGIATIDGLGPRGRGFHTKDEHIERTTFLLRVQALMAFLVGRGR